MELTPTWDTLREAWFKGKVFAGPSEKFDAEQAFDDFVKQWTVDSSDLGTLRLTYRNFGSRYERERKGWRANG